MDYAHVWHLLETEQLFYCSLVDIIQIDLFIPLVHCCLEEGTVYAQQRPKCVGWDELDDMVPDIVWKLFPWIIGR